MMKKKRQQKRGEKEGNTREKSKREKRTNGGAYSFTFKSADREHMNNAFV